MKGSVIAGILAAAGATLCCTGPALMLLFGSTALGMFSVFEHIRPYASVLAVGLLGFAFYRTYREKRDDCCDVNEEETMKKKKVQRRALFAATPVVLALVLFPYYGGSLYGSAGKGDEKAGAKSEWVVQGMTCEGCARGLQGAMTAVKGVESCSVDYTTKTMICTVDQKVLKSTEIPGLVEKTGYKAIQVQKDDTLKEGKTGATGPGRRRAGSVENVPGGPRSG